MRWFLLACLVVCGGCDLGLFDLSDGFNDDNDDRDRFKRLGQCTSAGIRDVGTIVATLLRALDTPGDVAEPITFHAPNASWLTPGGDTGVLEGTSAGDPREDGLHVGESVTFSVSIDVRQWSGRADVTVLRLPDGRLQVAGKITVNAPDCGLQATEIDVVVDPEYPDGTLRPEGTLELQTTLRGSPSRLALFVPSSGFSAAVIYGTMRFDGSPVAQVVGTFKNEPTAFAVTHEWRR